MEPTKKNSKGNRELSIADLLCSTGYLPPRNEHDVERFERIYSGRKFGCRAYAVNANAIFDKVIGNNEIKTRKVRPIATIFDRPGAFRMANSTSTLCEGSVAETLCLLKDKKD